MTSRDATVFLPDDLLRLIEPEAVIAYMQEHGWIVGESGQRWTLMTGPDDMRGQPLEAVIPRDKAQPDYPQYLRMVHGIIQALAEPLQEDEEDDDGE